MQGNLQFYQEELREMRACNKQLLGKLYADQLYLERLLVNPLFLNGRQSMTQLEKQLNRKEGKNRDADADSKENEDPIQRKVMNTKVIAILFVSCIFRWT